MGKQKGSPRFMRVEAGIAPVLIVLLVAAVIGGFLVYQKQLKSTIPQPSPSPASNTSNSNETANPDSIGANWKTYTSQDYKFSFKYPPQLRIENNSTGEIQILGEDYPIHDGRMFIRVATQKIVDTAPGVNVANLLPLKVGDKYGNAWMRFPDITIGNKVAKSYEQKSFSKEFIILESNLYYIISLNYVNGKIPEVFNQILSTFRFD